MRDDKTTIEAFEDLVDDTKIRRPYGLVIEPIRRPEDAMLLDLIEEPDVLEQARLLDAVARELIPQSWQHDPYHGPTAEERRAADTVAWCIAQFGQETSGHQALAAAALLGLTVRAKNAEKSYAVQAAEEAARIAARKENSQKAAAARVSGTHRLEEHARELAKRAMASGKTFPSRAALVRAIWDGLMAYRFELKAGGEHVPLLNGRTAERTVSDWLKGVWSPR